MCCGRDRRTWSGPVPQQRTAPAARGSTYFRYVGASSLTVIGRVTGRTYRFPMPGATIKADPRDAPAIAAVPLVVAVAAP